MIRILASCLIVCFFFSCGKKNDPTPAPPNPPSNPDFAKGADISWVTQMEGAGKKFYNSGGNGKECIQLLKNIVMDTIRRRVWGNPAEACGNRAAAVGQAVPV